MQQAIVRIQSEPNVTTNRSKFNDEIIKPTTITFNRKEDESTSPSSTRNNNKSSNFKIDKINNNLVDVNSQIMNITSKKKRTNLEPISTIIAVVQKSSIDPPGTILIFNRTATTNFPQTDATPRIRARDSPQFDQRLLVNNGTLTKESLISIITDYCATTSATDLITKFILNNSNQPRFKLKCNKSPTSHFSIAPNDVSPTTIQYSTLISTYDKNLYVDAVKMINSNKRKSINLKFNIKQMNKIIKDVQQTVTIPAQGDIGANVSATNNMSIIHNYFKYDKPVAVGVFSEDTKKEETLQALGEGFLKIILDQGSVMNWFILYTPRSTGTVLSLDNYHQNNLSKCFSFYHLGSSNNNGKLDF